MSSVGNLTHQTTHSDGGDFFFFVRLSDETSVSSVPLLQMSLGFYSCAIEMLIFLTSSDFQFSLKVWNILNILYLYKIFFFYQKKNIST